MPRMTDPMKEVVGRAAVERAVEVFEKLKDRDHQELVRARKAVTEHIFGLIAAGETDEQRLVVSGLAHLKSLESNAKPSGGKDARSLFSGPLRHSLKP